MEEKGRERDTFDAEELAVVLSHYDLGVIESITEFPRGSRKSPKVGVVCARGKFLLKRRDPERTSSSRISFAHRLQSHLASSSFPLPRLIAPVDADAPQDTVFHYRGFAYELFEYIAGHSYRGSLTETEDAGRTLALFHRSVQDFTLNGIVPRGDYHDANLVRTGLNSLPQRIGEDASVVGKEAEMMGTTQWFYDMYDTAALNVQRCDFEILPEQVIHSDWHPGNMLFKRGSVAAVIDYDSARISKRTIDIANGLLQFSFLTGSTPEEWPDEIDLQKFKAFYNGYINLLNITEDERESLIPLMIQALIAECVMPIARTGTFGNWQGLRFMKMVRRKVQWLTDHAAEIEKLY